jgi:hypothetical protein
LASGSKICPTVPTLPFHIAATVHSEGKAMMALANGLALAAATAPAIILSAALTKLPRPQRQRPLTLKHRSMVSGIAAKEPRVWVTP